MIELIKIVGGVCGAIMTIIGFSTFLIKPIRNGFVTWIKKIVGGSSEDIDEIKQLLKEHIEHDKDKNEAMLALLRDNITKTYHRYLNTDGLPSFERENICKQYESYKALGGNSYITLIVSDMMNWDVIK